MSRTNTELLRDLDPHNPASIQALVDFHRTTFGGFVMEAGDPDPDAKSESDKGGEKDDAGKDGKDDDALGDGGKKALQSEREARKELEKELREFKAGQASQAKKLAEALGVETKDAKSSDDITATLKTEVAEMRHELLVERVARAHKITNDDDLDLIRSAASEESMRKLATRLAGAAKAHDDGGEPDGKKAGTLRLKPDPSQGRGNGADGGKATSVAQVMADRAAARAAKKN